MTLKIHPEVKPVVWFFAIVFGISLVRDFIDGGYVPRKEEGLSTHYYGDSTYIMSTKIISVDYNEDARKDTRSDYRDY